MKRISLSLSLTHAHIHTPSLSLSQSLSRIILMACTKRNPRTKGKKENTNFHPFRLGRFQVDRYTISSTAPNPPPSPDQYPEMARGEDKRGKKTKISLIIPRFPPDQNDSALLRGVLYLPSSGNEGGVLIRGPLFVPSKENLANTLV